MIKSLVKVLHFIGSDANQYDYCDDDSHKLVEESEWEEITSNKLGRMNHLISNLNRVLENEFYLCAIKPEPEPEEDKDTISIDQLYKRAEEVNKQRRDEQAKKAAANKKREATLAANKKKKEAAEYERLKKQYEGNEGTE